MPAKTRPCQICGQMLSPERAEALPETRLCTEHAKQIQKYGGEFILSVGYERTSKAGSLKKNYGGAMVSRRRNHEAMSRLREEHLNAESQSAE